MEVGGRTGPRVESTPFGTGDLHARKRNQRIPLEFHPGCAIARICFPRRAPVAGLDVAVGQGLNPRGVARTRGRDRRTADLGTDGRYCCVSDRDPSKGNGIGSTSVEGQTHSTHFSGRKCDLRRPGFVSGEKDAVASFKGQGCRFEPTTVVCRGVDGNRMNHRRRPPLELDPRPVSFAVRDPPRGAIQRIPIVEERRHLPHAGRTRRRDLNVAWGGQRVRRKYGRHSNGEQSDHGADEDGPAWSHDTALESDSGG